MSSVYLAHHGIKGMRWGIRQWQNPDGSLTPAGRIRYGVGAGAKMAGSAAKTVGKATGAVVKTTGKAVGSAAKTVGKAIRKKVAPTDEELDEQIEAEKSKIRHKEKKEELKRLKETGKIEDPNDKVGHKKYSQMSDKEVDSRISRLKKEAELAELEFTKDMGPGKRMVLKALRDGASKGITTATQTAFTKLGKRFSDNILKDDSKKSDKNDDNDSNDNNNNNNNNNNNDNNNNNNSGGKKKKNKNKQNDTQKQSSEVSNDDARAEREREFGRKLRKVGDAARRAKIDAHAVRVVTESRVGRTIDTAKMNYRHKKMVRDNERFMRDLERDKKKSEYNNLIALNGSRTERQIKEQGPYVPFQNKKRVRHSGMELVYIPHIDK